MDLDLDEVDLNETEPSTLTGFNAAGALEQWAEEALTPRAGEAAALAARRAPGTVIFDIETGPRPWSEIEQFFTPPEPPGEFDPSTVKYGNAKAPEKRAEILKAASEKHAAAVRDHNKTIEAAKVEFLAKAALSPITGQVVAIGYLHADRKPEDRAVIDVAEKGLTEADLLGDFWTLYEITKEAKGRLVGHNIFGFDLPFMIQRSWLLGVDVPPDVLADNRYWSKVFIDTMTIWGCGEREYVKIDALARYFGVGRKPDDCTGADFARMVADEELHDTAIEYLKNDLVMTAGVAAKMGVI